MNLINNLVWIYILDDAKEKVKLTQKWSNLSEIGKNEIEIEKEVGKPKPDDVTTKRARKVLKKLNKDTDVVSSWYFRSFVIFILCFLNRFETRNYS